MASFICIRLGDQNAMGRRDQAANQRDRADASLKQAMKEFKNSEVAFLYPSSTK